MDSTKYLSVQSLTKYIKYKFEKDPYLQRVFLKGELSNVKHHTNGHIYFSIKDDKSVISAVMFRYDAEKLNFKPEEGQNVLLAGNITLYEARGQYQIYVKEMQIDGIGQLFLKLEQNKELLKKKGYLNPEHKKAIPAFPEHIAIVSSSTSAAIKDMITTLTRRYPLVKVSLLNTYVQGTRSQESVLTNLTLADKLGADTVILARGGGSIEDLWTFNELEVALAVFNMNTPVITGVGHETDITLVDYVSDLRAPTPTAAAEQAVPNIRDLQLRLVELHRQSDNLIMSKIDRSRKQLESLSNYYKFKNPNLLYTEQTERLRDLTVTIENHMSLSLSENRHMLNKHMSGLSYNNPAPGIRNSRAELLRTENELKHRMKAVLGKKTERLAGNINVLESVSPVQILKRGYSYTTFNNKIVTEAKNLNVGDVIETSFNRGRVSAKVTEVNTDD